jgi:hypothetical protein
MRFRPPVGAFFRRRRHKPAATTAPKAAETLALWADYGSAFGRVLPDIIIERDLPGATGVFRSCCRGR